MNTFFKIKKKTKEIKIKEAPSYPEEENKITIITDEYEAIEIIKQFQEQKKAFCFDYETTGKKPHVFGHDIKCISICNSLNKAYVFPLFDHHEFIEELQNLFKSDIGKIAHGIKFEDMWTYYVLDCKVNNFVWDTMVTAHILNPQRGTKGLKYQVEKRYGIKDYDIAVEPFLKSKEKGSHAFNKIKECPEDLLLMYNGLDSLFGYRLYRDEKKEIARNKLKIPNDFFHQGQLMLMEIEKNGWCIDKKYYIEQDKKLERQLSILKKKILRTDEAKQYPEENFNFNSTKQLGKLLFDILKIKPIKETAAGANSTDAEALEKINTKFTQLILQHKKIYKLKNTYIASLLREEFEGKIFPSYNLSIPESYRSSSTDPNLQNIPVRDKLAQETIRKGIIPSPGNMLMEVDYGSIEVRVGACLHKDPNMLNYIHDPNTDMHRDTAQELFIKNEVTEDERFYAKNNFVFAQFYGDFYKNCARNLWKSIDKETKEHLKTKGITTYRKFERHVQKIEDLFWNKRFKVYTKWKENIYNEYQKTGIVKLITGFVCKGYMRKNEVLNRPIQGPAFHCLLWAMIEIHNYLKTNGYETKIIGQIHDSIIFDVRPNELEELKPIIKKIMCEDIRKEWGWLIVPLEVDFEVSEINGNWCEMKKI